MNTPVDPLTALAQAYGERARIEQRITRLEAQIAAVKAAGQLAPLTRAVCGTDSKYQAHIRKHIPFPEDLGGEACGCRMAHARTESRAAAMRQARENRRGVAV